MDGTIFSYGVTSSGKTHTMTGTPGDPGVIGRAVADVFAAVERMPDRDFLLQLSMMEIYNEVRALSRSPDAQAERVCRMRHATRKYFQAPCCLLSAHPKGQVLPFMLIDEK